MNHFCNLKQVDISIKWFSPPYLTSLQNVSRKKEASLEFPLLTSGRLHSCEMDAVLQCFNSTLQQNSNNIQINVCTQVYKTSCINLAKNNDYMICCNLTMSFFFKTNFKTAQLTKRLSWTLFACQVKPSLSQYFLIYYTPHSAGYALN